MPDTAVNHASLPQAPQASPVTHAPWRAHSELLQAFLGRRADIVAGIERLLNCQKKPVEYQQDFVLLSQQFSACFFGLAGEGGNLRHDLQQAHWASGFKPRASPGNDLVDPVEQMIRALHMWRQTNWPGQKGRLRFANTLFNLYIVRSLALLCMRLWDADEHGVAERLAQAQALLDALWQSAPADQPRLVRDVRWLFPVALSPTTDSLAGYFEVAERIAQTFTDADRSETFKAWVVTGAGHLRSQLYHLATRRGLAIDSNELVLITRTSNALDLGLLVQGLVVLLQAYEQCAATAEHEGERLALASAICQGISPDPELFVKRLDLLGPYTMIEHLFITLDGAGHPRYTAMGRRHLDLVGQYRSLIGRMAGSLYRDCQQQRRTADRYSPYGVLYGFASNLLELMAFKTLQREAAVHFSMDDIFISGGADRLAWVNDWRRLPHIRPDVVKQFEYPPTFADDISTRVEQALQRRIAAADAGTGTSTGRLFIAADIAPDTGGQAPSVPAQIPALPTRYIAASDPQLVAAGCAEAKDEADLLHCRLEGEFLVSCASGGGWLAITKDLLTDIVGTGRDARISGLPRAAAEVLSLMCPGLVVLSAAADDDRHASAAPA